MTYEGLLNAELYLTTKTSSQNAYKEWTYTYTDATSTTKCRMVPIRVAERIDNPGLYSDVVYTCYTLSSASIDPMKYWEGVIFASDIGVTMTLDISSAFEL